MKKAKRFLSMAAVMMAVATLMGCDKDVQFGADGTVTCKTTVSVKEENSSKALTDGGVKTFAAGDQIAVIYKNSGGNTVKAVSEALTSDNITNDGKSATFTVTLDNPQENGYVRYVYPAAMAVGTPATSSDVNADANINYGALYNSQDGTIGTISSNFDLAVYDSTLNGSALPTGMSLENKLAILKFTSILDGSSSSIVNELRQIVITAGGHAYIVNRTAAAGTVFVAVRPVSGAEIKIEGAIGKNLLSKTISNVTLEASHLVPVSLKMTQVPGVLSGRFTVDASGTAVHFSQGNLRAVFATANNTSCTWQFANNQYSYIGNATANTAVGEGKVTTAGAVDLFGWSTTGNTNYGISESHSSNGSGYSGDFVDWGANAISNGGNEANQWRTLTGGSGDEWEWILGPSSNPNPGTNCRTSSTVNGTANARFAKAYLDTNSDGNGDVHGLIIFPDNYTHPGDVTLPTGINATDSTSWSNNVYNMTNWGEMEAAGAVFLPAAGYRNFINSSWSVVSSGVFGSYWSSTSNGISGAQNIRFGETNIYGSSNSTSTVYPRYRGNSVRLVR